MPSQIICTHWTGNSHGVASASGSGWQSYERREREKQVDKETVVVIENEPADDSDRTWHKDDDHWGWDIRCEECAVVATGKKYAGTGPRFNIARLKDQNANHYTTNELVQEHYAEARRTGKDISRAR